MLIFNHSCSHVLWFGLNTEEPAPVPMLFLPVGGVNVYLSTSERVSSESPPVFLQTRTPLYHSPFMVIAM